jgi:hypothetical protein
LALMEQMMMGWHAALLLLQCELRIQRAANAAPVRQLLTAGGYHAPPPFPHQPPAIVPIITLLLLLLLLLRDLSAPLEWPPVHDLPLRPTLGAHGTRRVGVGWQQLHGGNSVGISDSLVAHSP